ncbi:flagellar hook-associated protein 3 FlgL [Paracoccus isoporae]|uniref:Flagellar hook-associated protein 3 FlgL n=1 Tax=Paracoccus isoporae TaxID=591205 RepID=A0A1G6V344_9RHOB|nr:flagellin [Paracoccus isoporae]SDD47942.1 flagellar hook-associated protein 3 FlgL [Paracoccus isoporae]
MEFVSIGDLARSYAMRQAHGGLRREIRDLSEQVASGKPSDVARHLGGDLVELARLDRGLREAEAYLRVSSEAAATLAGMQSALGHLQEIAGGASQQMLSDAMLSSDHGIRTVADTIAAELDGALSALNISVGGRFVFSGQHVDRPPLVAADELIALAETVVTGAGSPAQALSELTAWFEAPAGGGGFSDLAYRGATGGGPELQIDPTTRVTLSQNAASRGIRQVVLGLTVSALVSRGAYAGDRAAQAELLQAAGTALADGNTELGLERAGLGVAEQTVERARVRMAHAQTTLSIARGQLTEVDGYAAGSRLIQAEAQLEALYALTARLSRLSLSRYL